MSPVSRVRRFARSLVMVASSLAVLVAIEIPANPAQAVAPNIPEISDIAIDEVAETVTVYFNPPVGGAAVTKYRVSGCSSTTVKNTTSSPIVLTFAEVCNGYGGLPAFRTQNPQSTINLSLAAGNSSGFGSESHSLSIYTNYISAPVITSVVPTKYGCIVNFNMPRSKISGAEVTYLVVQDEQDSISANGLPYVLNSTTGQAFVRRLPSGYGPTLGDGKAVLQFSGMMPPNSNPQDARGIPSAEFECSENSALTTTRPARPTMTVTPGDGKFTINWSVSSSGSTPIENGYISVVQLEDSQGPIPDPNAQTPTFIDQAWVEANCVDQTHFRTQYMCGYLNSNGRFAKSDWTDQYGLSMKSSGSIEVTGLYDPQQGQFSIPIVNGRTYLVTMWVTNLDEFFDGAGISEGAVLATVNPIGPPTVTAISPTSGYVTGGASVAITGTNFPTSGATVTIGGSPCTNVVRVSATQITCTTPSGTAGTASVVVTVGATANAANSLFTYLASPTLAPTTQTINGSVGSAIAQSSAFTTSNFLGGVTYAVTTGTLPAGLSLNPATGIVSGTPTSASSASITITASGASGGTATATMTFSIGTAATPSTLVGASNAATVAAAPGTGEALVDGKPVEVELLKVDVPAVAKEPELRSPAEVRQIQAAANSLVDQLNDLLPAGQAAPVEVKSTPTGAELSGIADIPVPVEDVAAVKLPDSAVLVAGTDSSGQKAASSDSGGVLEIVDGGQVATVAYGLAPGAAGGLYMLSTPILLDSFTVGTNGTFRRQTKLPATLEPGNHTIVVATPKLTVSLGLKVRERALPVRGDKVYAKLPGRVHTSTFLTVVTANQAESRRIRSLTPVVCLGAKYDVVFLNEGRCTIQIRDAKSGKTLRSLTTLVSERKKGQKTVGTRVDQLGPLYFQTGTTGLRAPALKTIASAKKAMTDATSILVVGHSGGALGNTLNNQRLSVDRALQVKKLLEKGGVSTPISTHGLGALDPVTTMVYEFAQQTNRRVAVYLIP